MDTTRCCLIGLKKSGVVSCSTSNQRLHLLEPIIMDRKTSRTILFVAAALLLTTQTAFSKEGFYTIGATAKHVNTEKVVTSPVEIDSTTVKKQ
jgi:hypothetical protein